MVFRGRLSDESPAMAKLPATGALFDQEVGVILPLKCSVVKSCMKSGRLIIPNMLIKELQRYTRFSNKPS